MSERPKIWRIGHAPAGMQQAELQMPPLHRSVATDRIWLGDYLMVSEAGARPAMVSELADHNGYAAENAEAGAPIRYYKRGDPEWNDAGNAAPPV